MSSLGGLGGKDSVWNSGRGVLKITRPAPNVYNIVFKGYLTVDLAQHIVETIEQESAPEMKIVAFQDWAAMEGYETAARVALTNFMLRMRSRFAAVHTLVASKIVSMGLSVANIALGGFLRSYSNRTDYEKTMHEQLALIRRGRL